MGSSCNSRRPYRIFDNTLPSTRHFSSLYLIQSGLTSLRSLSINWRNSSAPKREHPFVSALYEWRTFMKNPTNRNDSEKKPHSQLERKCCPSSNVRCSLAAKAPIKKRLQTASCRLASCEHLMCRKNCATCNFINTLKDNTLWTYTTFTCMLPVPHG